MQFQVPQNIDLEDKLVGPLTLIQFLYVLGGGLIDYILLNLLGPQFAFWLLAIPIALVSLGLAFLKIQEQPLSHFISTGLVYLSRPKLHIWQRQGETQTILTEPPPPKKSTQPIVIKTKPGKSELEQLAYTLDTSGPAPAEAKTFGKVTAAFEKIIQETPELIEQPQQPQQPNVESQK